MIYYSQHDQDRILNEIFFKDKRGGIFLDAGADDGISLSNTYFYELNLGWKGILFEPNVSMYMEAVKNRRNPVLNVALADKIGTTKFTMIEGYARTLSGITEMYSDNYRNEIYGRINNEIISFGGSKKEVDVVTLTLDSVLDMFGYVDVDLFSLDVEGSELLILENFNFSKYNIKVFTMENNYEEKIHRDFMESKGYRFHSQIKIDDVYVKIGSEYDI